MATVTHHFWPEQAQFLATNFPAFTLTAGTNFPVAALLYDDTTDESAFWKFVATSYGSGNLTLTLFWYNNAAATSGDVIWESQVSAITANTDTQDIETDGLATLNNVTDTHLGSTVQRLHSCAITISNLDSLAADDFVTLRIARDANTDTMAGDAALVYATLSYSDT